MTYNFKPRGICARNISFDLEEGKIHNVKFQGGCDGNHKGIAALCEGKEPQEVIDALRGVTCGFRPTSCPDQLSKALEEAVKGE